MAIAVVVVAAQPTAITMLHKIELPRRLHAAQPDRADRHDRDAAGQQQPRAQHLDRAMHARQQHGAGQIVHRGRRCDQRGWPATRRVQVGEIDRLAIEAEAPGECGGAEAGQHDGPALAEFARRGLRWMGRSQVRSCPQAVMQRAAEQTILHGAVRLRIFYPEAMPGLPPLNALRAFEASARHLSMKEAAAELSVTPGAVSQLVRGLEQRLGTQLFRRGNRSLVLTEAGQSYFVPIRHAFRQIGEATRRLRALPNAGVLTVSAPPAFAASWLVPRLGALPRAACRHRTEHRHHARSGEFRRRWRGCGDPPRPRTLSRPALRPHRQHCHDTGVQPAVSRLAAATQAAEVRPICSACRCCTMRIVRTGRCGFRRRMLPTSATPRRAASASTTRCC